jgi:hypothetical protein
MVCQLQVSKVYTFTLNSHGVQLHLICELCAILSGLVLATNYKQGQELFTDRDFASNTDFYKKVFELGC